MSSYGIGLFGLVPFFCAFAASMIYGSLGEQKTYRQLYAVSWLTIAALAVAFVLFALEGIICILMAAPFVLFFTWLGIQSAYYVLKFFRKRGTVLLSVFGLLLPLAVYTEAENTGEPELISVTTSIEINAPAEKVWDNVIKFPDIPPPRELLFREGIAYPTHAEINGTGKGAIRRCCFTTGDFIEPVTVWDEPRLLRFGVLSQPAPMKELSPYKNLQAEHLHGYFVSTQGQFLLKSLAPGKTLLEGTTWYYDKIEPAFYWKLWSDYIVHKIHQRVLSQIKVNAEKNE